MHLLKSLIYIITCLLFLSSCSQKVYFQDAVPTDRYEDRSKADVEIYTSYSGDALDYLVFELNIRNIGTDSIYLNHKNILLEVIDFDNGDTQFAIDPIYKEYIIDDLYDARRGVKSDRKARNIETAFGVGVGLLSLFSGNGIGLDAFNSVIFAIDVASVVVEDNRAYALIEGDIEDQIQYIEEWVLDDVTIGPNEQISFDILFDRIMVNGDADFTIKNEDIDFLENYQLNVVVEKVR